MRAPLDASAWSRIAPYLDQVLELEPPERETWMARLTSTHPQIASAVRELLAELDHLDAAGFLSQPRFAAGAIAASLSGARMGAYTLDRRIGRGGMGEVWLARRSDGRYEGNAAVKLLNAALVGRPAEQRFVREGSVLARLRHPNIAQLVDAGVAPGGQPYLVLEYIEGDRIDRYCEREQLGIGERIRLFLDVLAAVSHAHSHLVVHRDVKPSNILVTAAGTVKLLDFGVAALIGPAANEATREADPALTPGYAAPEQLLGQPVTTATDVYALGVVLFVLLTGRHPLGSDHRSSAELMRATLEQDAPRPSEVAADPGRARALRGDLDNILARALRREASGRYETSAAFAQDLRRLLACEPVAARPDSFAYRAGRFVRRHRVSIAAGAFVALVLVSATLVTTLQMIEARGQRDEARRQRDIAVYESQRAEFQARFASQIMSEVGGNGQPITIRQLMETGIGLLERNYGDDPRFVIGMLVNISGRYMDLGDTQGELAALEKAERIARRLGDPERIAFVQCNTVETELQAGRPRQAAERMRDGLANLAKVPNPPAHRVSECGLAHASLLWSEGKLPEAIAEAMKVARDMEARGETSALNYQSVTSKLELMLGEAGRLHEALEWNRRAGAANEQAGRGQTMSQLSVRHYEASHLYYLGQPRAALEIQRSIVRQLAAQQGDAAVPGGLNGRLGLYQVRVEESAAGLSLLDRGIAMSEAANNRASHIGTLLDRATANLWLGRIEPAAADVLAVEKMLAENPKDAYAAIRAARLVRAELHFARGSGVAALQEVEGLLEDLGYPKARVANRLRTAVTLRARAQLSLGRLDAALASAREAVAVAEGMALQADASAEVGAALMALAEAHRALGDSARALEAARRAAAVLTASLGPEHSETRAAREFH